MDRPADPHTTAVQATFELTADDLVRAFRLHNRALLWRWQTAATLALTLVIVGGIVDLASDGDLAAVAVTVASGALGAVVVSLAMLRFVVPARARRLHARSATVRAPLQLDADAEAMHVRASDGEARALWRDVPRWREDAHVLLLYQSPAIFHVVPKRVLAPGASDAMRAWHAAGRAALRPNAPAEPGRETVDSQEHEGAWPERGPWEPPVLATSATWTVTLADVVAGQRLHLRWRWRQPRALVLPLALAACAGAVVAGTPGATQEQVGEAALAAALVNVALRALFYALMPVLKRNAIRDQPSLAHAWRVELDAQGVRALTAHQDLRTPWTGYVAWAEDARVVLVYRNNILFQFMPTRAIDPDFRATFRELAGNLPRR